MVTALAMACSMVSCSAKSLPCCSAPSHYFS